MQKMLVKVLSHVNGYQLRCHSDCMVFTHSRTHSFTHLLTYSLTHFKGVIHQDLLKILMILQDDIRPVLLSMTKHGMKLVLTHSLTHSLNQLTQITYLLTYLLIYLLIHSFTLPVYLTHSLTHSLTYSLTQTADFLGSGSSTSSSEPLRIYYNYCIILMKISPFNGFRLVSLDPPR